MVDISECFLYGMRIINKGNIMKYYVIKVICEFCAYNYENLGVLVAVVVLGT